MPVGSKLRNPILPGCNHIGVRVRAAFALAGFCGLIGALVVARSVPPEFEKLASARTTISSSEQGRSPHDQRPRFDNNGTQWIAPVSNFHQIPPQAGSAHLTPVVLLFYGRQAKGFHYNRPPPVS